MLTSLSQSSSTENLLVQIDIKLPCPLIKVKVDSTFSLKGSDWGVSRALTTDFAMRGRRQA
jgi:hypothetical protein